MLILGPVGMEVVWKPEEVWARVPKRAQLRLDMFFSSCSGIFGVESPSLRHVKPEKRKAKS